MAGSNESELLQQYKNAVEEHTKLLKRLKELKPPEVRKLVELGNNVIPQIKKELDIFLEQNP